MKIYKILLISFFISLAACTKIKETFKGNGPAKDGTVSKGDIADFEFKQIFQKNGSYAIKASFPNPYPEDMNYTWTGKKDGKVAAEHSDVIPKNSKFLRFVPKEDYDSMTFEISKMVDGEKHFVAKTITILDKKSNAEPAKVEPQKVEDVAPTEDSGTEDSDAEGDAATEDSDTEDSDAEGDAATVE